MNLCLSAQHGAPSKSLKLTSVTSCKSQSRHLPAKLLHLYTCKQDKGPQTKRRGRGGVVLLIWFETRRARLVLLNERSVMTHTDLQHLSHATHNRQIAKFLNHQKNFLLFFMTLWKSLLHNLALRSLPPLSASFLDVSEKLATCPWCTTCSTDPKWLKNSLSRCKTIQSVRHIRQSLYTHPHSPEDRSDPQLMWVSSLKTMQTIVHERVNHFVMTWISGPDWMNIDSEESVSGWAMITHVPRGGEAQ